MDSPTSTFYVVDENEKLTGIISGTEIRPIISEYEHVRDVLVASDIANKNFTTVKSDDDLDYVLKLFGKENLDELNQYQRFDDIKYNFWLFLHHLKFNMKNNDDNIPWK